jgi:cytochrome c-type biogenesis protein CcmH/NrfG
MQGPDEMLAQIEKLKRAKRRWKITAICALVPLICLSLITLESYRARQAEAKKAIKAAQRLIGEGELETQAAEAQVQALREMKEAMEQLRTKENKPKNGPEKQRG